MKIEGKGLSIVLILGLTILLATLGACSSTATQTTQNITPYNPTITVVPEVYPPPQPHVTPVPYPVRPGNKATPYFSPTPDINLNADIIEISLKMQYKLYGTRIKVRRL